MPQYLNITDALMDAKRRARLSGRPISKQETAGIVAGAADSASARVARGKGIAIQEKRTALEETRMKQQETQFQRSQAVRGYEMQVQLDVASSAQKAETAKSTGAAIGAGLGAIAGGIIFPGFGALPGAAIGGILGGLLGSWF